MEEEEEDGKEKRKRNESAGTVGNEDRWKSEAGRGEEEEKKREVKK